MCARDLVSNADGAPYGPSPEPGEILESSSSAPANDPSLEPGEILELSSSAPATTPPASPAALHESDESVNGDSDTNDVGEDDDNEDDSVDPSRTQDSVASSQDQVPWHLYTRAGICVCEGEFGYDSDGEVRHYGLGCPTRF